MCGQSSILFVHEMNPFLMVISGITLTDLYPFKTYLLISTILSKLRERKK